MCAPRLVTRASECARATDATSRGAPHRTARWRTQVREWNVQVLLESDANRVSYTRGDNSPVVATDSIKNSVYVAAKSLVTPTSAEDFAALVAASLLSRYPRHSRVVAEVSEVPWVRANGGVAGDVPHDHGFVSCGAAGVRTVTAEARALSPAMGEVELTSGVRELRVLKSTQSGWEGFVRDGLTMLPPTRERMLASSVRWVRRVAGVPMGVCVGCVGAGAFRWRVR